MSLLTILQGPLDVTSALTHCVEVSIQRGDEEQCFWDCDGTTFEALGTEMSSEQGWVWGQATMAWTISGSPAAPAPSTPWQQTVGKGPSVPSHPH